IIVIDYKGINVEKANLFRSEVKNSNLRYFVVKNTLLRKAIENTKYEGLDKFLKGPTAIAVSGDDPVSMAKMIQDFSRKNNVLKVKGGFLVNEVLDFSDVVELSKLPPMEQLIGKAVYVIASPLINIINVLSSSIKNFIVILKLLEKQKDSEKSNNGG
ncbi:50S ribosomal protein L10, partial [bacterium]|nr:50S ribosomal protein L10 [bacterium]